MKTLEELLAEFNRLGEGQIVEVDVPNVVSFKAKIYWEHDQHPTIEISNINTNSIVAEIFGKANIGEVEAYFYKYHADSVAAFQKRIDEFDLDAQDWGIKLHNNHIAFYENHVW